MNKYQEYLNDEYRKNHEDAYFLTDEEIALMNPATPLDEKAFWYQERFASVVNAQRKVDLLISYIWHCKNLMNAKSTDQKTKDELNRKIASLVKEYNLAKKELAEAKFNSDELNVLFTNRGR